jgi:hypothetical protein
VAKHMRRLEIRDGRCVKSAGSILALLACCTSLMGSPTQRR